MIELDETKKKYDRIVDEVILKLTILFTGLGLIFGVLLDNLTLTIGSSCCFLVINMWAMKSTK
ncbi:MAG: hypothetical protein A2Z35_06000 [Actinobacteria bacterium RBG_19FT_COMBO_36_27]|nr:MAG: hypothetical protein A2Z35_06000 [Actinobacteria bacterium RBG_19FT_COMBO_36_27]